MEKENENKVIIPKTYVLDNKRTEKSKWDNLNRTYIDMTIYTGETFTLRVVEDKDGEDLIIGGDALYNTIHPGEWGDEHDGYDPNNPKAAEAVDGAVFFWTDDTTLGYDDEELRKEIAMENPEWFTDEDMYKE